MHHGEFVLVEDTPPRQFVENGVSGAGGVKYGPFDPVFCECLFEHRPITIPNNPGIIALEDVAIQFEAGIDKGADALEYQVAGDLLLIENRLSKDRSGDVRDSGNRRQIVIRERCRYG